MATNKHASIRYQALDKCFRNRGRKFFVEDLILACNVAVKFIEDSFSRGYVPEGGTEVYDILPPVNPFDRNANRQGVFQKVLDRLKAFFNKYFEIANGNFSEDNGE